MELNAGGEGIQYVTTGEGGDQQILIHGEGGQSLLQGAQIIDGKLVLPQPYQYVTENGETVMVVYETPDGQQMVSENGEQIVFLDESQAAQQGYEGAEQQGEPQTTYIQQVGEDGQTFLQQVTTTMAQEPQQTFIQIAADENNGQQQAFVQQEQQQPVEGGDGVTTFIQQPPQQPDEATAVSEAATAEQAFIEHQGAASVKPGQSLLLPSAVQNRQPQAQIHVAEGGPGSSTVVMVTSDQNQETSNINFIQSADGVVQQQQQDGMEMGQGDAAVIDQEEQATQQLLQHQPLEQQQYIEGMEYQQEGELQMNIQEAIQPDGSRIQIKILKGDEEDSTPQPIAVMNMQPNEEAATLMMQAAAAAAAGAPPAEAEPEPEPVPFDIDEEPDEEGRITMIDPSTGDLIKFMPQPQDDIPVLINPEEFENDQQDDDEEEDEDFGFGRKFDSEMKMAVNKGSAQTTSKPQQKRQSTAKQSTATPKLLSSSSVVVNDADIVKQGLERLGQVDDEDDDDEDDSDFDEENLTPKVVYERLLAQHRKTKECQVCGDMLDSYPLLKDHLMEHAGYNPCECQICGKILSTSSMRAKHERSHSMGKEDETKMTPKPNKPDNVKKFECDICGRQMGRIEHLKRHQLLHKPGPTWRCIICEYSFKREDLVKDHVKKQHKDALEQEELQDLYEKLEYEGEENHQHKSQWNPKAKHQRRGMTPRGGGSREDDDQDFTPKSTPKPRATPRAPKVLNTPVVVSFQTPDNEAEGAVTPLQSTEPKSAVKTEKRGRPAGGKKKSKQDDEKEYMTVVLPTPLGVRKSGRTPKPKILNDYIASEDAIRKAEKEAEKEAMKAAMEADEEDDEEEEEEVMEEEDIEGPSEPEKESPHADVPDQILTPEQLKLEPELDFEEEVIPDPPAKPAKDTRRTVGKTVVARYQGSAVMEGRGRKRKAESEPEDEIEEVVILDLKTPKTGGKGPSLWKTYRKSTAGSPSPVPSPSPATPTPAAKKPADSGAKATPSTSTGIPKGHKKIGEVTLVSAQGGSYEDDDFVYYDDNDEEYDVTQDDDYQVGDDTDDDELVVIRGKKAAGSANKKGGGKGPVVQPAKKVKVEILHSITEVNKSATKVKSYGQTTRESTQLFVDQSAKENESLSQGESPGVNVCQICDKSFPYKQSLQDHLRGLHAIGEPLACPCGEKFRWRSKFKRHKKACVTAMGSGAVSAAEMGEENEEGTVYAVIHPDTQAETNVEGNNVTNAETTTEANVDADALIAAHAIVKRETDAEASVEAEEAVANVERDPQANGEGGQAVEKPEINSEADVEGYAVENPESNPQADVEAGHVVANPEVDAEAQYAIANPETNSEANVEIRYVAAKPETNAEAQYAIENRETNAEPNVEIRYVVANPEAGEAQYAVENPETNGEANVEIRYVQSNPEMGGEAQYVIANPETDTETYTIVNPSAEGNEETYAVTHPESQGEMNVVYEVADPSMQTLTGEDNVEMNVEGQEIYTEMNGEATGHTYVEVDGQTYIATYTIAPSAGANA